MGLYDAIQKVEHLLIFTGDLVLLIVVLVAHAPVDLIDIFLPALQAATDSWQVLPEISALSA